MVRTGSLAVVVAVFVPGIVFAREQAKAPAYPAVERQVKVETHKGKTYSGKVRLERVVVDQDEGVYEIDPKNVKSIQCSTVEPDYHSYFPHVHGAVTTTSGKKFEGNLGFSEIRIAFDEATLALKNQEVKSIALEPLPEKKPDPKSVQTAPEKKPELKFVQTAPIQTRYEIVGGASGGSLLEAVRIEGSKITRIAVRFRGREWVSQELREPFEGVADPGMSTHLGVVYGLGRFVYLYVSSSNDWDVLELSKNAKAQPYWNGERIDVWDGDRRHTFDFEVGKWSHVDFGAILGLPTDKSNRPAETKE